ncbi:MAG: HAD-IA family hydrolase, partial [Lachnospiraceae bacterium]|nr:HAD-IA family hydrolase [Lachnospiraceae bacterium]
MNSESGIRIRMRYKNIIFDIGGVLLSYRWMGLIMETIPDEEEAKAFSKRLFHDPLWLEFDIGLRPFDDIIEDYVKKYPADEEHIRYMLGHLERMPLPRPRVWDKMRELKEAGYKLYLLSNYSHRMFHTHTDGLPFFDYIDGGIISYEVHQLKPHREIYESLFSRYDLDPAECIFFDDRQDNVDGGRKCGMDGRVIYSEEVLLGYIDRLLAPDGISNRFHDPAVSRKDRINWLLSEMSLEEKIILYSHPEKGVGRLGVEGFVLGGEAAHGVEARNEQNGIYDPDVTTSFPNPIGMSSSWDPELIHEAGSVVGTEARAGWKRHRKTGLSRWAPTVDPERDPRWGRNEEGYGEDPLLTSVNAVSYIRGMQGDDPEYIKCGATLKHFYANNREVDRFFTNSSIGLRDKYEYYMPPFFAALDEGRALGVMTSYNKINGVPGMTNPEVKDLLKDKHGLIHAVCDGFAMVRLKDFHHEYGTLAECMTDSIKAGVDSMSDKPEDVEKAVRDALKLGVLSESGLDGALFNILMAGMKLGIYDPEGVCPYDSISGTDLDIKEAREICRRLSEESLVLLENKGDILPLDIKKGDNIALAGPLADEWLKDWYAGNPPFCHTVKEGLDLLLGKDIPVSMGLDTYKIVDGDKAWHIDDDSFLSMSSVDEGSLFYIEDWGESYHTIRSVAAGKYVQALFYDVEDDEKEVLKADKDDVFDWFVTCRFSISDLGNGNIE